MGYFLLEHLNRCFIRASGYQSAERTYILRFAYDDGTYDVNDLN